MTVAPMPDPGGVRRDRYGEVVEEEPLELHVWDGRVADARRAAREALPERAAGPDPTSRRTDSLRRRLEAPRRRR